MFLFIPRRKEGQGSRFVHLQKMSDNLQPSEEREMRIHGGELVMGINVMEIDSIMTNNQFVPVSVTREQRQHEEKRIQMLHRKNEILARIVVGMSL